MVHFLNLQVMINLIVKLVLKISLILNTLEIIKREYFNEKNKSYDVCYFVGDRDNEFHYILLKKAQFVKSPVIKNGNLESGEVVFPLTQLFFSEIGPRPKEMIFLQQQ